MNKVFFCLVALLLNACSLSIGNRLPTTTVYDFGPEPVTKVATADWSNIRLDVQAISRLNSRWINYRLLYVDALVIRDYSNSRWVDHPAIMLRQSLGQQLGMGDNQLAACILNIEIQEFSHVFSSSEKSNGLLRVVADLSGSKHNRLAKHEFSVEVPAQSTNAAGGVMALISASLQLGEEVSGWLDTLAKDNRLGACKMQKN